MIGLTRLDAAAPTLGGNALTFAAVAVALIAFAALIPVERGAREPVISPALFGTRQLVIAARKRILAWMRPESTAIAKPSGWATRMGSRIAPIIRDPQVVMS